MSATTVKPDYVYQLIDKHKCVFFAVKTPDKGMLYGENQTDTTAPIAINLLRDVLNGIKGRTVLVELRPRARKVTGGQSGGDVRTGFFDLMVDISDSLPANERGSYGAPNQINGLDEILKREQQITQLKIEAIQREQAANAASPLVRIAEKFAENEKLINAISDRLLTALLPPPPPARAITGTAPDEVKDILNRLQKIDPDYLNTLLNLTNYLEANPSILSQVKLMITPQ